VEGRGTPRCTSGRCFWASLWCSISSCLSWSSAGLPEIRFHDLRHTCATLLLRQGVNPRFVQELLGHADISLTLNTYSHVLPDMGDAAAGGMDAALG
jgi:integrase